MKRLIDILALPIIFLAIIIWWFIIHEYTLDNAITNKKVFEGKLPVSRLEIYKQ